MDINKKIDVEEILKDIENYRPKHRERGWVWRDAGAHQYGDFVYYESGSPLKNSVPLPSARSLQNIDPQPDCVITTEIASGRFEDDIRRMRMAAWHGADHIMVIRTAGQSHFDGLIEGTTQGIGGIPVTRKQVRAQRKALDMIEEEVGRPINYHSYISGVAGPEIAVMFAEEGVAGAHQDPQYNVLYRNINMVRSFVDAAESKKIIQYANIAQIDGAHNANATAKDAWNVMPELLVQHAINSLFSEKIGIKPENILLSTVPPAAPPAPDIRLNLPYAIALRNLFSKYKMRAQMNTKYMDSSTREATVTHVLNLLVSRLTSADVQSTITPDEGRNVPWHIFNIEAVDTAKQALVGMDNLRELVNLNLDGELGDEVRQLKERAILYMEDILAQGGYFEAVGNASFIDSGFFPERNGDGIARDPEGGIGADAIFVRDEDYLAPVAAHYGYNNFEQYNVKDHLELIGECTLENLDLVTFIGELDETDNVHVRLEENKQYRNSNLLKPEVEWLADGIVAVDLFFPTSKMVAQAAALELGKKMNLEDVEVIHTEILHPAEGTRIQFKGRVPFDIDIDTLDIQEEPEVMSDKEITDFVNDNPILVVAGTIGQDEHSVGLREIIDIKHGGIERYGITYEYLGTSVPIEKMVDAAIELNAKAILISTIISHDDIHYKNMKKLVDYATEKGVRDKLVIIVGGTQVTPETAIKNGADAGFGRGTKGVHVATALVKALKEKQGK
ncbi:D-ornithine 4,5-aminomutase subunit beta [Bacilli bacterium PM5-3]|nr:D-ornithine 4,5-aminomutase subunit beta [Bacilli bacterium PM5-3]MDH6603636.1 D-ornithine 4,5-aminomutase subunit beta [Bacilli bacterium PM5-9]